MLIIFYCSLYTIKRLPEMYLNMRDHPLKLIKKKCITSLLPVITSWTELKNKPLLYKTVVYDMLVTGM